MKLAGDKGIEPLQEDSKSSALPLCKSPVESGAGRENRILTYALEVRQATITSYPRYITFYEVY